jgi:LysM repeat protein
MQKIYKLIISIITLTILSLGAFAQSKVEYRAVILDGKPARLNVATGKITLVVNSVYLEKAKQSKTSEQYLDEDASIDNTSNFHVVKEGETLFKIANRYNTSLMELRRANNLETTLVNKGQTLRVKNFNRETSKQVSQPTYKVNYEDVHSVEKGQTLYGIARSYNISINELKYYNNLSSSVIKIGQKLLVANFDTILEGGQVSVWTVSKGDTLYRIAQENGVTIDTIKSLNGLTGNLIHVGQKLQLK